MREEFRSYGANVIIAPAAAEAGRADAGMFLDDAWQGAVTQMAREIPGTMAVPVLYGVLRVSPEKSDPRSPEFENAVAVGARFGALERLNCGWRVVGDQVSGDLPEGACAIGTHLAARLRARAGDSIKLQPLGDAAQWNWAAPTTWRIAAVLATGASEDDQVFLPLGALQSLLGVRGETSIVELAIPGETRAVERAVESLSGLLPGLSVRPIRQIVYSEGKVLGTIRWLMLSLTILILVIIALCVMATMTAIVLERRKDIGVMKALGAGDALLMRVFLAEGAALGGAGGALGFAVGALLARGLAEKLFGVELSVNWWTLPLVCGLTMILSVIAAQLPLRIVRYVQPITAFIRE
jgi:putative ABC transport system permease protein